jgi:hypothetical protein
MRWFLLGLIVGLAGALVCVWVLSLRRLSAAQRPKFARTVWFRWGILLAGTFLAVSGFLMALRQNPFVGGLLLMGCLVFCALLLRYDQYAAMARIIYGDYLSLKKDHPGATDYDLHYSIVKSRQPRWSEERILEICAGKDIRQLTLLLLVLEFEIHPLQDMRIYERIKSQVEALYPARKN